MAEFFCKFFLKCLKILAFFGIVTVKSLIIKTQDAGPIRKLAKEKGFFTMMEDGIRKVMKGITTPQEVISVIKEV